MAKKDKQTSSSQAYTQLDPAVKAIIDDYVGQIGGLTSQPYQSYTGDRLADFTADELQSFDLVRNLVGQTQQGIGASQNILDQVAQRGLNGFDQATLDQYMNPYTTNVMDAARDRQLSSFDIQRRNLQQQQGATGAFGGSRSALAESSMYDNFNRQLAESEANLLYQGYNDAQNRAMAGTQLAGNAGMNLAQLALQNQQAGMTDAAALSAQGGQQRTLGQAGLDIAYQDFLAEQAYPYEQVQWGLNSILPIAQLTGTQIQNQQQTQKSGGGLGGALQTAVGLGSMAFGIPGVSSMMGSMMGGLGGALGSLMGSPAQAYANTGYGNTTMNAFRGGMGYYGPGFNKGGKVEAPSLEEMKAFDNLLAAMGPENAQILLAQPKTDSAPQATGEELLDWIQRTNSEGMGLGAYAPGFDKGGQVSWLDRLFNFDPNSQEYQDELAVAEGGLAQRASNLYDSLPPSMKKTVDWAKENPVDAASYAMMALPGAGVLTGAVAKAAPAAVRGGASIAKAIAKNPKTASMLGGLGLYTANHAGDVSDSDLRAAALENDPGAAMLEMTDAQRLAASQGLNPNDPYVLESMQARIDSGLINDINSPGYAGGLPVDTSRQIDMSLPGFDLGNPSDPVDARVASLIQQMDNPNAAIPERAIPQNKDKEPEWDPSLFNFGAAVLASNGSFAQAIGEGGKAFSATKRQNKLDVQAREDAIRDRARQAIQDRLAERRVAAYEMQNQISAAMAPYRMQNLVLKNQQAQNKLSQMPQIQQKMVQDLYKQKSERASMYNEPEPVLADIIAEVELTFGGNSGTIAPTTKTRPAPPQGNWK